MSVVAPIAGVSAVDPGRSSGSRPATTRRRRRSRASRARSPASGSRRSSTRRARGASRPASGSRCSRRSGSASTSRGCTRPARSTSGGRRSSSARRRSLLVARRRRRAAAVDVRLRPAERSRSSSRVGIGDTLGNVLFAASSRARPRQPDGGARVALPDRDGAARGEPSCASASRADAARAAIVLDARRRRCSISRLRRFVASPDLPQTLKRMFRTSPSRDDVGLALEALLALLRDLGVRAELDEVLPVRRPRSG